MVNRLNLTGKHPKTKRKLQNPEERKRDRERGRERASTILQNPTNYNQTKPSTGNHNKCKKRNLRRSKKREKERVRKTYIEDEALVGSFPCETTSEI